MRLSPPKMVTWWIGVILGVLGILGMFVRLPVLGPYTQYLLALGFLILAISTVVDGM